MIEESLLKSNYAGKDGFIWWVGQVASPESWKNEKARVDTEGSWAFRCKVRIIGYHTFDGNVLPDDDLPWAHILTSGAEGSPGQGGFGKTPNLMGGESVLGFFLDGEEAQQPVVVSCFYRNDSVQNLITPELLEKEKSSQFKPFTGMQGNLSATSTRMKPPDKGTVQKPPTVTNAGSDQAAVSFTQNNQIDFSDAYAANKDFASPYTFNADLNLGIGTDINSPNYSSIFSDTNSAAGSIFNNPDISYDKLFSGSLANAGFLKQFSSEAVGPVQSENGCENNFIAEMQATLQSFVKFINGLESTIYGFIDPIRNVVVNVKDNIRRVARLLTSIFKFILNGVRDNITKLIGCLFRAFAVTTPLPQWLQLSEAAKNILNIIFCIFEKLFGPLLDFIIGLLDALIGKSPNVPVCAVEETIASIIGKASDLLTDALDSVLSGIDWLTGGIGQIADYITGAFDMLNQLLGFLSCDNLKCEPKSFWDPFEGVKFPSSDDWAKTLNNFDLLGGAGAEVDEWASLLSMYGGQETLFADCREEALNPTDQDGVSSTPIGSQWYYCIPPEVIIYGDGYGAAGTAVVSPTDGSILTISVTNPGANYTKNPTVEIKDNSNYGSGALAKSKINDKGEIESIYITSAGSGYCQTNLTTIGIGTTSGTGDGTTTITGIGSTSIGISTNPVGIITNFVVEKPGYGYTSGDSITAGGCIFKIVITPNGSIIGVSSGFSSCNSQFTSSPSITINTNTGQGALLYPVLQYVPQYVVDPGTPGIGTDRIVNVVQCV